MKLLRTEQNVYVYHKKSKRSDEAVQEINIDIIPTNVLKKIVVPRKDDPELFEGYGLDKKQLDTINAYINNEIVVNLKLYNYVLVREGIYEWDK
jgi:hypothetical protein